MKFSGYVLYVTMKMEVHIENLKFGEEMRSDLRCSQIEEDRNMKMTFFQL